MTRDRDRDPGSEVWGRQGCANGQAPVGVGLGVDRTMVRGGDCVRDRVDGLGLGADDCLTKPFAFAELAARVQLHVNRGA